MAINNLTDHLGPAVPIPLPNGPSLADEHLAPAVPIALPHDPNLDDEYV